MLPERSGVPSIQRPRSDFGFGLAETIVTIVILGTAFLGIAGTAAHVGAGLNSTHERTRAMTIAQNQLENLLAVPYDQLVAGSRLVEGVSLAWRVIERDGAKEIELAASWSTRSRARSQWLTAARLKP